MIKDVAEKQDLLCQASKALELLDEQKGSEKECSELLTEELKQKIESLQFEVQSLQSALIDANKSTLANDTGYADFLGAVDSKDIEIQRQIADNKAKEESYKKMLDGMQQQLDELSGKKKEIEKKTALLQFENQEMKDKLNHIENGMQEQVRKLIKIPPTPDIKRLRQLKKFKILKELCLEKFNDLDVAQTKHKSLLEKNQILESKCDELEISLCELSQSRPMKENDFLVILNVV